MLCDVLASKSWFGFDLDDTLHEFRKASRIASHDVFANIAAHFGDAIDVLEKDYAAILKTATRSAFTEGRTSTEYRKERFAALLDGRGFECTETYLNSLVEQYKCALGNALQLKSGALELLQYLREQGKKVIIVTEGPTDAQIWTVQQLGLEPYVDVLITTNEVGKSKVDGLFTELLRTRNIRPQDMVYVGDNEARDVIPAMQLGILAVHYSEKEELLLDFPNDCTVNQLAERPFLRVNSLAKIQQVMQYP
jgi:putative hydrolase of the HAD superfamily